MVAVGRSKEIATAPSVSYPTGPWSSESDRHCEPVKEEEEEPPKQEEEEALLSLSSSNLSEKENDLLFSSASCSGATEMSTTATATASSPVPSVSSTSQQEADPVALVNGGTAGKTSSQKSSKLDSGVDSEEKKSEKVEEYEQEKEMIPGQMAVKNKNRNDIDGGAATTTTAAQHQRDASEGSSLGGGGSAVNVMTPEAATTLSPSVTVALKNSTTKANNEKTSSMENKIASTPSVTPGTKTESLRSGGNGGGGGGNGGGGGGSTGGGSTSTSEAQRISSLDRAQEQAVSDLEDSKTPERRYEEDDYDSSNDDSSYFADPSNLPSPKSDRRRYSFSSQNSASGVPQPRAGRGARNSNNNHSSARESDASLSLSDDSDDDHPAHPHTDPHLYEPPRGGQTPEVFPQRITRIHSVGSLVSTSSQNTDEDPVLKDELNNVALERHGSNISGYDNTRRGAGGGSSNIPSGRVSPLTAHMTFSPSSNSHMPQASPPPIMQQGYPYPSPSDYPHPQPQMMSHHQQQQQQAWLAAAAAQQGPVGGTQYATGLQTSGSGWSDGTLNYSEDSHAFHQQNPNAANERRSGGGSGRGKRGISRDDQGRRRSADGAPRINDNGAGAMENGGSSSKEKGTKSKSSTKKANGGGGHHGGHGPNGDHVDGEGNFKVYWQRWIMLMYMSVLNLLSDWTCYSVAPIAILTQEAFGKINAEQLVVVFLCANAVSTACEPIILSRLGLRRTVLFGALLLMIGSIVKSGGMPPIIQAELHKGQGEWRVYLGFFLVGLSQPLYQCTPALLSASWFPEKERTMATGVALNANQLGIGFAFIFGTLLVAKSDDIPSYFGLLSVISTITFFGALFQFDDAPPTPPSDTARVVRGTLDVQIPTVASILQYVGYSPSHSRQTNVVQAASQPPVNNASDSTASQSKSRSGKSRRSRNKNKQSSSSGIARRRQPNAPSGVAPAPSPALYDGPVSDIVPAPSPMMPGPVAGSSASSGPDESGRESEDVDPNAPTPPFGPPGMYPGMPPPGGYAVPPGMAFGPDGAPQQQQYPPYGYPFQGMPPGMPPYQQPPPYWDPRFQQYPPYALPAPPQQGQQAQQQQGQQPPYMYPPPQQQMMNPYYSYQHGAAGHDPYALPRNPYIDAQAMLPPPSAIDEGAEPILTISPHHLDINIRDDQVLLSLKACFSRPGFIHSLVSFTVSGIVINTLSTYMDYLVRLNGVGREYTGIVGGSFQFVIMCSSLIVGSLTDRSRAYYSVTIGMLVLGAFGLAQCGVSLNADKGSQLRWSLVVVAALVGPLQPVSTELGVEVVYPLSENTVLVIQQLFSNLLSALFIPCFKAMKDIGINKIDEEAEQPEYTFSFYLLIVLHAAATVWFATFNGRYLRYEHELIKKEEQEIKRSQQAANVSYQQGGGYEQSAEGAPLLVQQPSSHPLV